MENQLYKALSKCMAMCSKAEKCTFDIQKKLNEWEISESDSQRIISQLKQERFIDEERYAGFFVRDKFRFNQWGKIKIAFYLRNKNICESTIKQALGQIDDKEYLQVLKTLLRQKSKSVKAGSDYEKNAKLIRFAQGRGFEYEMIAKALKAL